MHKKKIEPLPDHLQIYPPQNTKYDTGGFSAEASIWYSDRTETKTFGNNINMDKFKTATISLECYANHGSGQTPYVRLDVINVNGNVIRNVYYSTASSLGHTWTATVTVSRSDITAGLVRLRGTAFASVYSPDNPSWSVRRISITKIVLNNV